jgi:hypothetical protein
MDFNLSIGLLSGKACMYEGDCVLPPGSDRIATTTLRIAKPETG